MELMGLRLFVTAFSRRTERLVEQLELPLAAAENLRPLFTGLPAVPPYFFDCHPVTTPAQVQAIQKWCPGALFDLNLRSYFIALETT